jgi:tetratricopeptide (TPR) repeat protein
MTHLFNLSGDILLQPWFLISLAFQVWMLIDAVRRQEYLWAIFIFFFSIISAVLYFFLVYRQSASITRGFELPGSHHRKRIKELQAQIHHLDKAHHYLQLGDIYFQQGKLEKAEECYRSSLERDPSDLDAVAHLGQCLLRKNQLDEARPLLEKACQQNVKHDYGHTTMAYAECLGALNEIDPAIEQWKLILQHFSYARARVQLAELYLHKGEKEKAAQELREAIHDDLHAASFQRKREKIWIQKARKLQKML